MQAAILRFPENDMTVTESRFNKLEARVNDIGDRLVRVETATGATKPDQGWKSYLPIGAPLAMFLVVIITMWISLSEKIEKIQTRLGKLESAVKVLADNQKNPTKELLHDLLAAAKSASPEVAQRATAAASNLVKALTQKGEPADSEFFSDIFRETQSLTETHADPAIRLASLNLEQQLAEYRSSLEPPSVVGITLDCSSLPNAVAYVNASGTMKAIANGGIRNCVQPLDDVAWINMTFINSKILYSGGHVILQNVRFIHCTFEIPKDHTGTAGAALLRYAALGEKEFRFPSNIEIPNGM